jgi:hypothetical protein
MNAGIKYGIVLEECKRSLIGIYRVWFTLERGLTGTGLAWHDWAWACGVEGEQWQGGWDRLTAAPPFDPS